MTTFGVLLGIWMVGAQGASSPPHVTFHDGVVDVHESDKDIRLAVAELYAAKYPHYSAEYYLDPAVRGRVFVDLRGVNFYDALRIMAAQVGAGFPTSGYMDPSVPDHRENFGHIFVGIRPLLKTDIQKDPLSLVFAGDQLPINGRIQGAKVKLMRGRQVDGPNLLGELVGGTGKRVSFSPLVQGPVTVDAQNTDVLACLQLVLDALHAELLNSDSGQGGPTIQPKRPSLPQNPTYWTINTDMQDIRLVLAQIFESTDALHYDITPNIRKLAWLRATNETLDELMDDLAADVRLKVKKVGTTYFFTE